MHRRLVNVGGFKEQSARRGFTARQSRLLDLEAVYEGTQYDDLLPWEPATRVIGGVERFVLCCERKPAIQVGIVTDKVDKLLDRLVGEGRVPTLVEVPDGIETVLVEQVGIADILLLAAKDLIVKGAAAAGFARLPDKRFEPLILDVTWCEPIFVAQAGDRRAFEIRDELAEMGIALPASAEGDALAVPPGAESHDLCFLRYEYPFTRDERDGSTATKTKHYRRRVDYLPHAIIAYEDVPVDEHNVDVPPAWKPLPVRPHNWGVVPIAWARSRGARPGESEGPSLITSAVESLARAMDYAESMKHDAVKLVAWPQLAEIDLDNIVDRINAENSLDGRVAATPSSPAAVLRYRSRIGMKGDVKILETTGSGIEAARKHVDDLRGHADRVTGVLEHDQSEAAGALSGTALERMLEPTIARVNAYRAALGAMLVTLAKKIGVVMREDASKASVRWPRVVAMTPADLQAAAQALSTAAGGAAVISQKTAVELFAKLAELPDAEDELARLEEDADTAMQRAREALASKPAPGKGKPEEPGTEAT